MPLVSIKHQNSYSQEKLSRIKQYIPPIVSETLACPEEPYDKSLKPGDITLCVHNVELLSDFDVLLEIQTKFYESRAADLQERVDTIEAELQKLEVGKVGVWVSLQKGAWAQS